jgi:hypothetical protein
VNFAPIAILCALGMPVGTLDFEFPRLGMIRVDAFDHVLADLRASMK